jgi:protein-S-isoprenylcysteine O-methyltransferase Ste14
MTFTITRSRVFISRAFGALIILLVLFTGHSFTQENALDILFEVSGLILLTIGSLGRLWALLYISGNKRKQLVTEGPYSMTRHPLYLFSFIGTIGIGLASENLLVLGLLIIFFIAYYPFAIIAEEKVLLETFGDKYRSYMERTPRFWPRLSLYYASDIYRVKICEFIWKLGDAMWFIWIFIFLHFVEVLQGAGILPVVFRVP